MSSFGVPEHSTLGRFLQFVMRSFAIGTFFGVHVRMYWMAAVFMPLVFALELGEWPGTAAERFVLVAIMFAGLFFVIWTHEMGHIVAGRRVRIRTTLITLSPLGGLAHMHERARTPAEDLSISLSGPFVHLLWLALLLPLSWALPARVTSIDGWTSCPLVFTADYLFGLNVVLLLFNLLPVFPLDGGRALRALLSLRWHPNLATMWAGTIGIVGGAIMMVVGLWYRSWQGSLLFLIGLTCIMASIQERRLARHVLVYGQARRDPWEGDPDAWKHGGGAAGGAAEPRRLGRFAQWRADRAAKKARASAEAEAALDREVDSILDRVHRVGMTGLSDREKAVLKRASQRRRGAG